jgi:hypothetical protein
MPHFLRSGVRVIEITTNPTVNASKTRKYMSYHTCMRRALGTQTKQLCPITPPSPGQCLINILLSEGAMTKQKHEACNSTV